MLAGSVVDTFSSDPNSLNLQNQALFYHSTGNIYKLIMKIESNFIQPHQEAVKAKK